MRMSRNGFIIHFVISLKPDRPYKATVIYNFATVVYSDIPRQTVVYQLYTTARGFDVAHTVLHSQLVYGCHLKFGKHMCCFLTSNIFLKYFVIAQISIRDNI